jgi:hypothetical protein
MEYLEKEAIGVAPTPLSPGFYASIFLYRINQENGELS